MPLRKSKLRRFLLDPVTAAFDCPEGSAPVPGGSVVLSGWTKEVNQRGEVFYLPPEVAHIEPFCLGVTEVTVGMIGGVGVDAQSEAGRLPAEVRYATAVEYCTKHALRVPSQAEWVAALFGSMSARFPWGDQVPDDGVCWQRPPGSPLCPVGSSRLDVTREGIWDLVANAKEWVTSSTAPYPPPFVEVCVQTVGIRHDDCGAPYLGLEQRGPHVDPTDPDEQTRSAFRCVFAHR